MSGSSSKAVWSEMNHAVRETRRQFASLAVRVPSNFSFRYISPGLTRIYFLASPQAGKDTTLLFVDVMDDGCTSVSPELRELTWNGLIEATFQSVASAPMAVKISKEEQLLLERKRLSWSWGISGYDAHLAKGKFVISSAGSLYACIDSATQVTWPTSSNGCSPPSSSPSISHPSYSGASSVFPFELKSQSDAARLNATLCPSDPDLVAYVCSGDIWVHQSTSEQEVRLTYARRNSEPCWPISAGLPAYVTQEEFNRFTGFWWRPESASRDDSYHYILYEEVNESQVELIKFPTSVLGEAEEFRFPRAGSANAISTLKMVRFRTHCAQVLEVQHLELCFDLKAAFPWMEYLVRAGWTPDGEYIWVQLLDRRQQLLQLVLIPASQFVIIPEQHEMGQQCNGSLKSAISCPAAVCQVICQARSDTWINVSDILYFLPSSDANRIRFIWASEESKWCHLYLITAQLQMVAANQHELTFHPHLISQQPLTSGEWSVLDKAVMVDVDRQLVYFHALKDSPLEKHLYVVSMKHPYGFIKRLTTPGFSHVVHMDKNCTLLVSVYSSIQSLPACQVFRIAHSDSEGVGVAPIGWILAPTPLDKSYEHPELFSHAISSGDTLYGMIFKPHDMSVGVQYPVILSVYGGPEVQLVSNTFKGMRYMRNHLLASQGYCVVSIDSRGSHFRGVAFESHLRLKMGQMELADQVEVLEWLASTTGYIDMDRVAIHGWSYGGYLSLMALVQYPNIFKVAIAGAPVTDWSLYDTAYTERYMDLPSNNPSGYSLGSVLNFGNQFPDEPNRLMIVHGLMDDNVHFFHHTAQLISLFIRFGKPYQLQIYPSERHSLRHLDAYEHFETTLLSFLKANL